MNGTGAIRTDTIRPIDPIWSAVRGEAAAAVERDPLLAAFIYSTILNHQNLESAVIHRLSERLDHSDMPADLIRQTYHAMLRETPELGVTMRVDIQA